MAAICALPIEMRLEILEKLSLHELVVNSSKTCHQWRDDIAQHILAPKILALAEVNEKFKMDIKEKGWAEEEANNTTELIMSLYETLPYAALLELPPDLANPQKAPCVNVPEWFVRRRRVVFE